MTLISVLVALVGACRGALDRHYSSPLERFDVKGRNWYVVLPRMERVRVELLTLLVNMEGMDGVFDLVRGHTGVDLADEQLLSRAGVDPEMQPVVFEHRGGVTFCMGLTSPSDFVGYVKHAAAAIGASLEVVRTDGPTLYRIGEQLAFGVDGNLAVIVLADQQVLPLLASLLLSPPPETPAKFDPELLHYALKAPDAKALKQKGASILKALGPLAGVWRALNRFLSSCEGFEGTIELGDRILVSHLNKGCTFSAGSESLFNPESMLPDDTVLLFHGRLPGRSLGDSIPAAVRFFVNRVTASLLPGELGKGQGALSASPAAGVSNMGPEGGGGLLESFGPEVAIAVLGLDPEVAAEAFVPGTDIERFLFAVHGALILPCRTPELLDRLLTPEFFSKWLKGFDTTEVTSGSIKGLEMCRKRKGGRECFAAIRKDSLLVLVTGVGEGARVVATLQGTARSLKDSLFARAESGMFTVTLKTRRLVRDLANKGFPPYFLHVLSSLLEVRFSLTPSNGNCRLALETVLR